MLRSPMLGDWRIGGDAVRPFDDIPSSVLTDCRTVLADLDDTLTTGGRLEAASYSALELLQCAGFRMVIITGRPAGWCDLIARLWPVDAVVGENGAFAMRYDRAERRMCTSYCQQDLEFQQNRSRLSVVAQRICDEVPGAAIASDQQYRLCDLAVDIAEDVPDVSQEEIACILRIFSEAGATSKISSIHVNGWFGTWDKLAMTRRLFQDCWGLDLAVERRKCLYIGDSPNDAPMFGWFPFSVGVASMCSASCQVWILRLAYVTRQSCGARLLWPWVHRRCSPTVRGPRHAVMSHDGIWPGSWTLALGAATARGVRWSHGHDRTS